MYGIISIGSENIHTSGEDYYSRETLNLFYHTSDLDELRAKLRELWLRPAHYGAILIFEVDNSIDIKLLGTEHARSFPHYEVKLSSLGFTDISYNNEELVRNTLLFDDNISQFLRTRKMVKREKWSKKRFEHEFDILGYTHSKWYGSASYYNFLQKYFAHLFANPKYIQMRDQIIKEDWSKKRFKAEFLKLGYKKTVWYRTRASLLESYLDTYCPLGT